MISLQYINNTIQFIKVIIFINIFFLILKLIDFNISYLKLAFGSSFGINVHVTANERIPLHWQINQRSSSSSFFNLN